jgi:hypothetical protein
MKFNNYETPEIEVVKVDAEDVITTSLGDTPSVDWGW